MNGSDIGRYETQASYNNAGQDRPARTVGAITGSIGQLEKAMAGLMAMVERMEGHLESSGLLRAGIAPGNQKEGIPGANNDSSLSNNIRAQAHRAAAMEQRLGMLLDRLDV